MVMKILSACAIVVLTAAVVQAAGSGAEINELTGPATMIFEGLRFTDFIKGVGIVVLGMLGWGMYQGHFGMGILPLVGGLIALGFWFQPEAIAEAINLTAAVM